LAVTLFSCFELAGYDDAERFSEGCESFHASAKFSYFLETRIFFSAASSLLLRES
jgi:hypothetical protein